MSDNIESRFIGKAEHLKKYLTWFVKGQPKAVDALCRAYEYDLTLRPLEKKPSPTAVLLFLGPSGVGKTELARSLSRYFSNEMDSLIKIDCAQFSQPHAIHSLIGAPHSYTGYNDEAILSQKKIDQLLDRRSDAENARMNVVIEKYNNAKSRKRQLKDQIEDVQFSLETIDFFMSYLSNYCDMIDGPFRASGDISGGDSLLTLREILLNPKQKWLILKYLESKYVQFLEKDIKDNRLINEAKIVGLNTERKMLTDKALQLSKEWDQCCREFAVIENNLNHNQIETDKKRSRKIVILFDEIEKANATLHQLLLGIMEDGKIVLANGSVTNLENAFIILTSNVGARSIGDILKNRRIGYGGLTAISEYDRPDKRFLELEKKILVVAEKELEKVFSPEFRRRIDDVVVFRPLRTEALAEILDLQIWELAESFRNIFHSELIISQEVKSSIILHSLHRPEVGASLLSHKFKSLVKIPLGREILKRGNRVGGVVKVFHSPTGKILFDFLEAQ